MVEAMWHPMCVRDNRNKEFHKIRLFGAKHPKTCFLMKLNSILETFWEPSSLTYFLLVAPVANTVIFFVKVILGVLFVA